MTKKKEKKIYVKPSLKVIKISTKDNRKIPGIVGPTAMSCPGPTHCP